MGWNNYSNRQYYSSKGYSPMRNYTYKSPVKKYGVKEGEGRNGKPYIRAWRATKNGIITVLVVPTQFSDVIKTDKKKRTYYSAMAIIKSVYGKSKCNAIVYPHAVHLSNGMTISRTKEWFGFLSKNRK